MAEVATSEKNAPEPGLKPPAPAPINPIQESQGRKIYTVSRGATITPKGFSNYSHAYHENSFWVDLPIYLEAIGFLGPYKKTKERYEVTIEISKSLYGKVERHAEIVFNATSDGQSIQTKVKEIFHINTGKLLLHPSVWYHVRFILKGPDTAILDDGDLDNTSKEVRVEPIGWDNRDTVVFQFLNKSRQMPEMKFSLVPKVEYDRIRIQGETGADGNCCCSVV